MTPMTNGFPIGYPTPNYPQGYNPYQVTTQQVSQQPTNNTSSIVWVQGEAGAKAYPVAAGNTVMMLDSENAVFYLKTTDASGMPMPLRIFDFTERTETTPSAVDMNNFITREEFEDRISKITSKKEETHETKKRQSAV